MTERRSPTMLALAAALLVAFLVAACGSTATSPGASAGGTSGIGAAASATPAGPAVTLPNAASAADSSAPSGSSSATASTAVTGPTPKPIASVKGSGFTDSKTFKLKAGAYLVRWALTSPNGAGCAGLGALHTPDGKTSIEVANTTAAGPQSGQKSASKVKAATYLVTFATSCNWTAQVYQQ
jgi:hypothetical protein